jgi:Flp pilus assembly pilin Flp
MKNFLRKIARERDAVTLVEYGLLVGVLGLSIVFGLNAFTNQLYRLWHIVDTTRPRRPIPIKCILGFPA